MVRDYRGYGSRGKGLGWGLWDALYRHLEATPQLMALHAAKSTGVAKWNPQLMDLRLFTPFAQASLLFAPSLCVNPPSCNTARRRRNCDSQALHAGACMYEKGFSTCAVRVQLCKRNRHKPQTLRP